MLQKLSIIIPLHNEEWNIKLLLESFRNYLNYNFELILVDDGSTDNTSSILEELKWNYPYLNYITYDKNKWYWWAILVWLGQSSWDVLSWFHSDLQTDTKYIFDAYEVYAKSSDKNILVKWRRKNRKLSQIVFSNIMSFICSFVFLSKLFEINAQPKLFPRELYLQFKNPPVDYSLDLYLLVLAKNKWFKIKSIDVNFKDRAYWESKWNSTFRLKIKTIIKTLKYIINLRIW